MPQSAATPETVFNAHHAKKTSGDRHLSRRRLLIGAAASSVGLSLGGCIQEASSQTKSTAKTPSAGDAWTPPPPQNKAFADAGRPITAESLSATYNNFYEFGSHKRISERAQRLQTDEWPIIIDGHVEKPFKIEARELIAMMPNEERVVRHRCVETWSMTVPWIGFPLKSLVKMAKPLSRAKFIRFETFVDQSVAPGQRQPWHPWPYTEGLTLAEAANDLSFMVTGAYGKILHKQFGAPIRLHTPWKYGFKSIKSIVKISFVDQQPVSFWEELQAKEYGFWANVNPDVSHPRWSQATEQLLGEEERIPTEIYNGYGEQVAYLYNGMTGLGDRLFR